MTSQVLQWLCSFSNRVLPWELFPAGCSGAIEQPNFVVGGGRTEVLLFYDCSLRRPTGESLRPGTKVLAVSFVSETGAAVAECAEGAARVTSAAGSGWLEAARLRKLPAPKAGARKTGGHCEVCCHFLPRSAFSKRGRGHLDGGLPATCETCLDATAARQKLLPKLACGREAGAWTLVAAICAAVVHQAGMRFGAYAAAFLSLLMCLWLRFCRSTYGEQATREPTLTEQPLHLVGHGSHRPWETCVSDEWGRSFSSLCPMLLRMLFCRSGSPSWLHTMVGSSHACHREKVAPQGSLVRIGRLQVLIRVWRDILASCDVATVVGRYPGLCVGSPWQMQR